MMKRFHFAVAAALLASAPTSGVAVGALDVFTRAKTFYAARNFDSTIAVLKAFVRDHGKDPDNEVLVPLLVESLLRKNQTSYAERLMAIYEKKYPRSVFMPRMLYLKGVLLARSEQYAPAVTAFSDAVSRGLPAALDSLAAANVRTVCEVALTLSELDNLAGDQRLHPRIREAVKYHGIVRSFDAGEIDRAIQSVEGFRREFPHSRFLPDLRDAASRAKSLHGDQIQIGLLSPISGYDAEIGKQIVRGVQVSVEQHNLQGPPLVKLVVCDTRGSAVETAHRTLELLDKHKVSMILGPVLSTDAVVTASILLNREALMITPTATDDGIAELGSNIFQMNVSLGELGLKIARYAMQNLNIKEFAVISPLSEYGTTLSRRFREYVESNGGEIVAEEFFDEGVSDFRQQFGSLRSKLILRRRVKLAAEQGLDYTPSTADLRTDSVRLADSTLAVGGLFIPAGSEDVVMLAPQVFFHKIRTQMLGCTGWHNEKTVNDGKRYVNNAIIATNLQTGQDSAGWQAFRALYKARFSADPDRVAAMGYDAAELLLRALQQAKWETDVKRVCAALLSINGYEGVSGRISFDPVTGANTEAAIVKIADKQFVRIQ